MDIKEVCRLLNGQWSNDTYGLWSFSGQENNSTFGTLTLLNKTEKNYKVSFNPNINKHTIDFKDNNVFTIEFIYENVLLLICRDIEYRFLKLL